MGIFQSRWFYSGGAIVLLLLGVFLSVDVEFPKRPTGSVEDIAGLPERDDLNVIFILIDTLRADHLGAYGYERDTSPTIDRLAETGVLFSRNVAQSTWTKTSMASMWTGTYPITNGITHFSHKLPEATTMPAELFKEAGYRTGGIVRNGWLSPTFGFQQGFDLYVTPDVVVTPGKLERRTQSSHPLSGSDWDLTLSAQEFLRRNVHERFFLYLHYMDVHQYVFEEESALFGTRYEDSYDNAIHWTDRNVGALLESVEDLGLMDETLVVIASDHGEGFREHGTEGHARNLYGEVVETPLIFILPFFLRDGLVIDELVENVDVLPTILELAGLPPLPDAQGRSLVPLMLGQEDAKPGPAYGFLDRNWAKELPPNPIVAVTDDTDRLIYWRDKDPAQIELFDKLEDPTEQEDIATTVPERRDELLALADGYFEFPKASWGEKPDEVELDEISRGILEALGYVVGD